MKITFSCSQKYFDRVEKKDFPCPASSAIENWYKPIKHDDLKKTLKGCMPFLDGMTAGYVLKLPQDFAIGLNHTDQQNNCLMHRVYPSTNDNFNEDINLNHGSYNNYIKRLTEKLNLFVIIYGVDRKTKNIYIREVLYANNSLLLNNNIIEVKRNNNNCSMISIKNKDRLCKLKFRQNTILNFEEEI